MPYQPSKFVSIIIRLHPRAVEALDAARGKMTRDEFVLRATQYVVSNQVRPPTYDPAAWQRRTATTP